MATREVGTTVESGVVVEDVPEPEPAIPAEVHLTGGGPADRHTDASEGVALPPGRGAAGEDLGHPSGVDVLVGRDCNGAGGQRDADQRRGAHAEESAPGERQRWPAAARLAGAAVAGAMVGGIVEGFDARHRVGLRSSEIDFFGALTVVPCSLQGQGGSASSLGLSIHCPITVQWVGLLVVRCRHPATVALRVVRRASRYRAADQQPRLLSRGQSMIPRMSPSSPSRCSVAPVDANHSHSSRAWYSRRRRPPWPASLTIPAGRP